MSTNKYLDLTDVIEDLFDQIYDLQDFIKDSGLDERDFIQWQKDRDTVTYHQEE